MPSVTRHTGHAWSSRTLPFLEQVNLYEEINYETGWFAPENQTPASTRLSVYRCPASWKNYEGLTDYCGISGSWINVNRNGSRNGVLFPETTRHRSIRVRDVLDGLSSTICVAEGVAVSQQHGGYWASGMNCFSHDDGGINNLRGGFKEIASLHPNGANVVFCDASVHFLSQAIDVDTIGALCTRNQQEVVKWEF
ncbi:MAG: DUF1559 domain-containing protein [Planctomycetota bacterium]